MSDVIVEAGGILIFGAHRYRCVLGKGGITDHKREGDGAAPRGNFPLREVYFRSDKIERPQTGLPVRALHPDDGWCDDAARPEYNTRVTLPFNGKHEHLWRDDDLYDIIVVIGYNDAPVVAGDGSAIFMHIARPDHAPTDGCVALSKQDLLEVLRGCADRTEIRIGVQ